MNNLIQDILFFCLFTNLSLLLFIVKTGRRCILKNLLILYISSIIGWTLGIIVTIKYQNIFSAKLTFIFSLLSLYTLYWFIKIFPKNKFQIKKRDYLILITTLAILASSFIDGALFKEISVISESYIKISNGYLSSIYSILTICYIFFSLLILHRKQMAEKKNELKRQEKNLFWGLLFFLFFTLITNSILPVFFNIYNLNGIGPIFSLALTFSMVYMIKKYNFLDIRIIIQKSLIYTILLSLITITYLLLISIVGYFFQKTTNTAVIISAIFTTVLGIFTVPRIEEIFCRMTDKIFFKDKYNYGEAIHQLSQVLNKNIEPEELLEKTMTTLKTILRVKDVKIILKDHAMFTENGLESNDEENIDDLYQVSKRENFNTLIRSEIPYLLENAQEKGNTSFVYVLERAKKFSEKYGTEIYTLVPINEDIIAIIASGEKKSGDPYSDDDFRLLDTFSNQMAVALSKADLYKKVKNHSLDLEKKVAHRTSEIRKLQEEQERMILDISHGLQTPLTIIRGELEFLQAQTGNRKLKDFEKSIDNISKFIYDLLTLSKLQSNTQNMRMEDLDLSEIVEILVDYFPTLVQDKNIEIKHHIEPNILMHGNKNKLEELVNNLVSNSIKYIGHGNFISISLFRRGSSIILEIEDNGIGIAEKDLPHIFERFYRANTKTKGSGLGLAICREIANKHNGKIRVESELGKWTKFTITLKNSSNVL